MGCLTVPSYLSNLGPQLTQAAVTSGFPSEGTWLVAAVVPCRCARFPAGEPEGLPGISTGLMPKEASDLARKKSDLLLKVV